MAELRGGGRDGEQTFPGLAAGIKHSLATGNQDMIIRLIIQSSDDFGHLDSEQDIGFFLNEPSTTGDPRYDALLSGLAVHLTRRAGIDRTPSWTAQPKRYLSANWYFGAAEKTPKLRAQALRDAIPSMRARGVLFSRKNLESV